MKIVEFVLMLFVASCVGNVAAAQEYPVKPIMMIVPFAPGGVNDLVGRPVAQELSKVLGKQVVVENYGGAGGTIGSSRVAAAAPDGYTLIVDSIGPLAIAPNFYPHLSYNPVKAFAPISLLMTSPMILLVNPIVPAKSIRSLIRLAEARPGQLTFGSAGTGSMPHLAGALFARMAKVRMIHVPYQSSGAAVLDLLAGHIDLMFGPVALALPNVKTGKLRALAVSTTKRFALLPELPTINETGVPGYDVSQWWGILAPAKTPSAIIQRLNQEIVNILATQKVKDVYARFGGIPTSDSPDQFAKFIAAQDRKWASVIAKAHVTMAK